MYVLLIKVPIRKKSGNFFNDPRNWIKYQKYCGVILFLLWPVGVRSNIFILNMNTWSHTTLYKLFELDRNTSYITASKTFKKQLHENVTIDIWSYWPIPSARAGYDTRSIFKRILTGLNSEFSFSKTSCLTKAEESSMPYYLPIAGGRIIGFIPFTRVLVLCAMQSVSSRIWTRVAVSIFYDDNHYTTGTSII